MPDFINLYFEFGDKKYTLIELELTLCLRVFFSGLFLVLDKK